MALANATIQNPQALAAALSMLEGSGAKMGGSNAKTSLGAALGKYSGRTKGLVTRSKYLEQALAQMAAGSKPDPQSLGEALSRVGQAYLLKRGADNTGAELAKSEMADREAAGAPTRAWLDSVATPPTLPAGISAPVTPEAAASPQAVAPAPQAQPSGTALAAALSGNPVPNRSNGSSPIGIRQNNPGNLRDTSIPWRGAVGSAGGFETFDTPENGIRATARNLQTYGKRGLNTPEAVIGRWAPPGENDTAGYVSAVSQALGVSPDAALDMGDPQTLARLTGAIIQHENGQNPYSQEQILAAVNSALGGAAPAQAGEPSPSMGQPTADGASGALAVAPGGPPSAPPGAPSMPLTMAGAAAPAPQGPPQGRQPTPQQIAIVREMLANPATYDQGIAFAQKLRLESAEPLKNEVQTVNGVPMLVDPYSGQIRALDVPEAARSQLVSPSDLGISAPQGTAFSRSPTGDVKSVYAPQTGQQVVSAPGGQYREAPISGGVNDPTSPKNLMENEGRLRTDYAKAVADYSEARLGYDKVVRAAKDNTGASDIALIFGFMKTLDPSSTVREGEFATAQNSGSVPDTILNAYNKAIKGERLQPEQRRQFADTAGRQFGVYEDRAKATNERFTGLAQRYGLDPRAIVQEIEPVAGVQSGPASGAGSDQPNGAQRGRDGGWYIPDPTKPGSFPRVDRAPDGKWYFKNANGQFVRVD